MEADEFLRRLLGQWQDHLPARRRLPPGRVTGPAARSEHVP